MVIGGFYASSYITYYRRISTKAKVKDKISNNFMPSTW
jgi:hypothetical protein